MSATREEDSNVTITSRFPTLNRLCLNGELLNLGRWIPLGLLNRWWGRNRVPPQDFLALPLEVMTEILKNVHWRDLLIIRQVCTRLNETSRLRAVWASQYQQYITEKTYRPTMEKSLDCYSPEELELWVLQRRSADQSWGLGGQVARERTISIEDFPYIFLIPGGRWLLVCLLDGSVISYDLDHPAMQSQILTPPRDDPHDLVIYHMAVDIDETTQNLRFNLVTFPNSYPGLYSDAPTKGSLDIIVWRVDLCGHGTAACLEATLLHSFLATENDTGVASINLRGDLLARCMSRSTMNPHYIEVFDWRLSESSRHRRLVILLELAAYCQSVVLLPGNRLLVVCVDALFLYNVGSLTDQDPDTPLPQRPQCSEWKLAGDYEFETASHISIEDQAVSIVLTAKQTIYRLRIPQDADHPYLTRLAQASEHFRYSSVGFEKALMGTRCSFIKLSWHCSSKREDEHSLIISSRLERILSNDYIEFILDEQTGRIVVCADDIIVVLDTTAFLPVSGRY